MVAELTGRTTAITDRSAHTSTTRKTKRQYFPELHGIRAIAVLAMLLLHTSLAAGALYYTGHKGAGLLSIPLERFGREGLPILFALTGLLIFRPFALAILTNAPKPKLGTYTWRRILRIFPGYWLLAAVILLTIDLPNITGIGYLLRVVLMQDVYNANAIPTGMEQTWSMASDTASYALIPLLAWLCTKITRGVADPVAKAKRMLIPMAALILLGYGYFGWAHQAVFGPWSNQGLIPLGWFGFVTVGMALATLSALAETVPGTFLGWYRIAARRPVLCWGLALATILLFCFSPFGDQGANNYPNVAIALFDQPIDLMIVTLVMAPLTVPNARRTFITKALTWRPLVFMATISYGVYLWHIAVIYWLLGGVLGNHNLVWALAVVISTSTVLATISYYLVERPALTLRRRLGKTTTGPSVEVLASTASR